MIKIPIVDAHLHLWDRSLLRYSWLVEGVPALDREFLLSDYHAATEAVQIDKIVFLEADCAPEQFQAETDWVTALAKEDPRIEGIVARASLEECDQIRPTAWSWTTRRTNNSSAQRAAGRQSSATRLT